MGLGHDLKIDDFAAPKAAGSAHQSVKFNSFSNLIWPKLQPLTLKFAAIQTSLVVLLLIDQQVVAVHRSRDVVSNIGLRHKAQLRSVGAKRNSLV